MREDGPSSELEDFAPLGVFVDDRRADDVRRHQIGGELDARKGERERFGHRLDEHGLAETGDSLEQRMRTGEHAGECTIDDLAVADHDFANLFPQHADAPLEQLHLYPCRHLYAVIHGSLISLSRKDAVILADG